VWSLAIKPTYGLEERARGRSKVWYWGQVLIAIWTGIWSNVFAHKVLLCVLSLRAVLSMVFGSFSG
jgi:hypothetical protein